MNLRALIVEDEPLARTHLRALVSGCAGIECVGEAHDGRNAVTLIDLLKPEVVFMDVRLPELSGIDVLTKITHAPSIVFTTAYDQFAITAFQLGAIDYLLKPFASDRFAQTIARLLACSTASDDSLPMRACSVFNAISITRLFARSGNNVFPINVRDVLRFQATDDYVSVHLHTAQHLISVSLNELEARLDSNQFIRVHRAHLVNLDHVERFIQSDDRRFRIRMHDGTEIMSSRASSQRLRALIS